MIEIDGWDCVDVFVRHNPKMCSKMTSSLNLNFKFFMHDLIILGDNFVKLFELASQERKYSLKL